MEKQAPQWWITMELAKKQHQGSTITAGTDAGTSTSNTTAAVTHMDTYAFISQINDDDENSVSTTSFLAADTDFAYSQGTTAPILKEALSWPGRVAVTYGSGDMVSCIVSSDKGRRRNKDGVDKMALHHSIKASPQRSKMSG
jgi:hypothetical protein